MRLLEGKVLRGHELQHVQRMTFRGVLAVPKQRVCLSFCYLPKFDGVANQFCDRAVHLFVHQTLRETTPKLLPLRGVV